MDSCPTPDAWGGMPMKAGKGFDTPGIELHGVPRLLGLGIGGVARSRGMVRLRALAVRHPGRTVILLGTVIWALVIVGGRGGSRSHFPPAYVTLAKRLADECQSGRDEPEPGRDINVILAELRNASLDLNGLKTGDPDVAAIAEEARGVFRDAATSLERLSSLPRPPGQLELSGEFFLRGFALDIPGLLRRYDQVSGVQDDLLAEARRLATILKRGEASRLMLPQIAARYSGPPRKAGPALKIDFDESWGPVGPGDWLTMSNVSGGDLHDATVLVEVRGEAGDVARSVHFVPSWRAGTAIDARYTGGDESLGFPVGRQTVANVASVTVSLWSEELRQEGIAYHYLGAEHDADVARYCAAMRVRARFRPFQTGIVWDTQRGMELWLDGIAALPRPRITATFRRKADVRAWYWDFPRWDQGERKVLDAGKALPWDPEEVTVEMSFPRTGHRYVTRWPGG